MTTLLITGFGPFPGAPYNPTELLVRQLARVRRPALSDIKIVPHIFTTSYAAVDRDLPALVTHHKPDAILMFGLAARTKHIRIEMRARNALALLPDATNASLGRRTIVAGAEALTLPAPTRYLLSSARAARVPAALSRDAGRYLCNYLCWRAAEAVATEKNGPRLAAFIHVPLVSRKPRRRGPRRRFTADDLLRAGTGVLLTIAAAARR